MSLWPERWKWENATAGAVAGFATLAVMHPLDVIRTRFQVNYGRISNLPTYKNCAQILFGFVCELCAMLGATSKLAAILLSYPFQVFRARLQQRPGKDGTPRYMDSWHVAKDTAR